MKRIATFAFLLGILGQIALAQHQRNADYYHNYSSASISDRQVEEKIHAFQSHLKTHDYRAAYDLANELAAYFLQTDRYDRALIYYDHAADLGARLGDLPGRMLALSAKSELLILQSRHQEAITCNRKLHRIYLDNNESNFAWVVIAEIGEAYRNLGMLDSAVHYLGLAHTEITKLESTEGVGYVNNSLALLHRDLGNYDQALEYYLQNLRLYEEKNHQYGKITTLNHLSDFLIEQGKLQKAASYASEALALAEQENLVTTRANIFKTLGKIKVGEGAFDDAVSLYLDALRIYESKSKNSQAAHIHYQIGDIHYRQKNYSAAMQAFQKSLVIADTLQDLKQAIEANLGIALIHLDQKRYTPALELLGDIQAPCEELAIPALTQKVYKAMAVSYAQSGQFDKAYYYQLQHAALGDSIFSQDQAKIVEELQAKYELEIKEKSIAELMQRAQYRAEELQQQRLFIGLLLVGMAILLAIAIFFYRNLEKNKLIARQKQALNLSRIVKLEQEKKLVALKSVIEGQEQERKRIANDLHDGLGGLLSTVKFQFGRIKNNSFSADQQSALEKGNELLDIACQEVRKIAHNMMPGAIAKFGLVSAIQDMCHAVEQSQQIKVLFQTINWDAPIPENQSINIYRIIQELLSNIVKYAQATEVMVQLSRDHQTIHLTVEDNGVGFDPETVDSENSLGLKSVAMRVEYLEGKLEIDSVRDQGTSFIITLPMA